VRKRSDPLKGNGGTGEKEKEGRQPTPLVACHSKEDRSPRAFPEKGTFLIFSEKGGGKRKSRTRERRGPQVSLLEGKAAVFSMGGKEGKKRREPAYPTAFLKNERSEKTRKRDLFLGGRKKKKTKKHRQDKPFYSRRKRACVKFEEKMAFIGKKREGPREPRCPGLPERKSAETGGKKKNSFALCSEEKKREGKAKGGVVLATGLGGKRSSYSGRANAREKGKKENSSKKRV